VSKAVSKKADAKKTSAKLKLKAIADGSHGIDGGIYTFKKGDTVTVSKKAHYDSMMKLACFNEV
jgi:hypothetical protein